MATIETSAALGTFHGSEQFPIEWEEGEHELFWIYDDLHCPNPVSPMFFDIGGWWLTCDHMFRRFGTPFACDWIAKEINGYVYTAAIPADPPIHAEATEYQARYAPRVPRDGDHAGADRRLPRPGCCRTTPRTSSTGGSDRLRPEIERNFEYLDGYDTDAAGFVELAVLLEDAIDIHDRHWKIHWMLNFAQFASTQALNGAARGGEGRGGRRADGPSAELGRRPQLGLDRGPLEDEGGDQGGRRAARGVRGRHRRGVIEALEGSEAAGASSPSDSSRTRRPSATRRSGRTSSPSRPGARTRRR